MSISYVFSISFPIFTFVNYTLLIKGAEYMPLTKLQITNIKIKKIWLVKNLFWEKYLLSLCLLHSVCLQTLRLNTTRLED